MSQARSHSSRAGLTLQGARRRRCSIRGYTLDFPDTAGNCGTCHVPTAAADDPYGVEPDELVGVATEGITCDFCHKVWDVILDPATAMPLVNRPGVLSFELRRPPDGHQFFTGPFDDVAPGEDTYSQLQTESAYCAPCHFGAFWDVVVTLAREESGRTCRTAAGLGSSRHRNGGVGMP